jgi:hypothetical protein
MIDSNDIGWFKTTFGPEIATATAGTPFTVDLLTAIACQETGFIWATLRHELPVPAILELCVGDMLDRKSTFPKNKADLLTAPRGDEMFEIAHRALLNLASRFKAYTPKRSTQFCRGFGIFQYDLQFFKKDPDYFLERRWARFDECLRKCIEELHAAAGRAKLAGKMPLTNEEMVYVAIAYNAGRVKLSEGFKQGYYDKRTKRYYGEYVFDYLRLAQTVGTPAAPAAVAPPAREGVAAVRSPTPVAAGGDLFDVDVTDARLRVRSSPQIDAARPTKNVIAHLPDGHRVRRIAGSSGDAFFEIETSLNGAYLRGFAAAQYLVPAEDAAPIAVIHPAETPPLTGIVAAHLPRKSNTVTRRRDPAGAYSLNEPDRPPPRSGTTPEALRAELAAIIEYLGVDKPSHARYQPRDGLTFCNIYAHDYCDLAGVYLPRVWWLPDAIERLARGETVEPRYGSTVSEQRANDLFRWLAAFGPRFGWRQTGTLTKLQSDANVGAVCVIVAARKENGRPGHISVVVPETAEHSARRDGSGAVIAPLQSQAGTTNFRYGTGTAGWWLGQQFADHAFWVHP